MTVDVSTIMAQITPMISMVLAIMLVVMLIRELRGAFH